MPRQGLFSPQQPTEPQQSLCPVRACFPPSSPQSTLLFNGIYKNREKKRKSVILFFTQLHLVSKKMRFSKIANLLNAPAIHNQKITVKTFQLPPAVAYKTHTEPLPRQARACFIPSPQRPHRPVRACHPPAQQCHRALCYSTVYIKTARNGESVISIFIQLQFVSKPFTYLPEPFLPPPLVALYFISTPHLPPPHLLPLTVLST